MPAPPVASLAARLSEDPDVSVTLIEAGPADTAQELHIPAAFAALQKSDLDWDLTSEPEPGLDGRRTYLPRGKVLGGTSNLNAMVYIRGNQADYNEWAEGGAEGWSYDDVLPYFKKAEDNERGEDQFHGVGGPLGVSEGRSMNPLADAWIEAAKALGHEANPDFNGARQEGVGRYQTTQRNGMRCGTVRGLHPSGRGPSEPRGGHRWARDPDPLRGHAGGRCRAQPRRPARGDPRRARGHPLGRRLQLAPASDALRHRPGGRPRAAR